jgi:bacteriocin-like protein
MKTTINKTSKFDINNFKTLNDEELERITGGSNDNFWYWVGYNLSKAEQYLVTKESGGRAF